MPDCSTTIPVERAIACSRNDPHRPRIRAMARARTAARSASAAWPFGRARRAHQSRLQVPRFRGEFARSGSSWVLGAPFERDGRFAAERRVAARRVVPALDGLEDRHAGLRLGAERAPVEQLAFERGIEALAHGGRTGASDRARRRADPGLRAAQAERHGHAPGPLPAMANGGPWPSLADRHAHRVDDEPRLEIVARRPTDDAARPGIEDGGQGDGARPGRDVGDVARHCPRTNGGRGSPQSWSGASARKVRSTRSPAGRRRSSRIVMRVPFRRPTPTRAAAFIGLPTRSRPTLMPSSASSA